KAISLAAVRHCPRKEAAEPIRLDSSEDRDSQGRNVDGPPSDAVHVEATGAIPRFQVEGAVDLAAGPLEGGEPPDKLVSIQEDAPWFADQDFAHLFDRGIVDDVSPLTQACRRLRLEPEELFLRLIERLAIA